TLEPEEIIRFLNRYFSHLIQVIQDHQGIIVDFFGDAVLVFFDPFDEPVKPMVGKAVQCAFKMQGSMKDFNREMLSEKLPPLQMGIGINAGEVVVGNIGSETRAKYGIVGSPVNLTQRIQSTAEEGEVVVSDSVYKYIQNDVRVKREFRIMLKGVQDEATLYGVEAMESL
ncbi:MAG TPA: adenylate/guanylate cyclase domain-containing protein, partial [Deltaproteobacteria bacterium]|nr:adenylate/guanylate cyclase domain-containing protein [Deltaproteobacteria bacterium]